MRRLLPLLTVWALAGAAMADPAGIRLQPTADGVRVDYRLPAPTTRFVFESPLSPAAQITAGEEGVTVTPEAVASEQPLSAFSLLIRPDSRRADATYPVLSRLGEGWMIHLPSLRGEAGATLQVVVEPGPGWSLVAGPGAQPLDGFVYVGPGALDPSVGARSIIEAALPAWLGADARSGLESSNAFYARGLGLPAPGRPVLLMGALPAGDLSSFVGDVTPNGVINLQFSERMIPSERDQRINDMVVPFVAHETFHVWQGDGYRDAEGVNGRWLTEGSAEYFSLLAQADQSPAAAARSREMLARRLGACLSAMESRPQGLIALSGSAAESTRYDCGTVSQWLADRQMKADGGLFAVWRRLLSRPDGYGVAEFRAELAQNPSGADAGQAALLDGSADIRGAVLTALGSEVESADPGASAWASAALWPLLQTSCNGQMGIRTENGRFFLDTGNRCGVLSGDLEAVSIDGRRFDAAGEAAFRALEAACARGGTVAVGLMDGAVVRDVEASCRRPSKPPAPAYRVGRLP
jgi:hypothetical protein